MAQEALTACRRREPGVVIRVVVADDQAPVRSAGVRLLVLTTSRCSGPSRKSVAALAIRDADAAPTLHRPSPGEASAEAAEAAVAESAIITP